MLGHSPAEPAAREGGDVSSSTIDPSTREAPSTTGGPLVEARGLSRRYRGGTLAVDGLDLDIGHGEVYGFLGPNGAGKTTTIRMLLGLIRPTSGTATVAGASPGARPAWPGSAAWSRPRPSTTT